MNSWRRRGKQDHLRLSELVRGGTASCQQGEEIMATETMTTRPPLPPFTLESAIQKVRLAEDAWNTRDPGK